MHLEKEGYVLTKAPVFVRQHEVIDPLPCCLFTLSTGSRIWPRRLGLLTSLPNAYSCTLILYISYAFSCVDEHLSLVDVDELARLGVSDVGAGGRGAAGPRRYLLFLNNGHLFHRFLRGRDQALGPVVPHRVQHAFGPVVFLAGGEIDLVQAGVVVSGVNGRDAFVRHGVVPYDAQLDERQRVALHHVGSPDDAHDEGALFGPPAHERAAAARRDGAASDAKR